MISQNQQFQNTNPIILVTKKIGDLRMCADYRKLNSITKKDHYPLLRIDDQLERLAGNIHFTTLGLKLDHHLRLAKESHFWIDQRTSGFPTCNERNSRSLALLICLGLLDDVLIISKSVEEGLTRLETVLQTSRSLNKQKCSFLKRKVEYLGSVISDNELRPAQQKVETVLNFSELENVHDV